MMELWIRGMCLAAFGTTFGTESRAIARILQLPIILERMPVKKVDAAGKTQVERAVVRVPSRVGCRAGLRVPGGGPGGRAPGSSGVLPILNALGTLSWAFINTL